MPPPARGRADVASGAALARGKVDCCALTAHQAVIAAMLIAHRRQERMSIGL